MTGALVILAAMLLVGGILYVTDVKYFRHHHRVNTSSEMGSEQSGNPEESISSSDLYSEKEISLATPCCGLHLICEKTTLNNFTSEPIYYDDEELDRFKGRHAESYSNKEIEEFRDVMMTLLPQDIAGWAQSISSRQINLPSEVKDELMLLLSES